MVKEACRALEIEGSKISARNVYARVGGSMTTVLNYLQQYQAESAAAAAAGSAKLSDSVVKAILVEIGRQTEEAQTHAQLMIDQATERESVAVEALEVAEKQLGNLQHQLGQVKELAEQNRLVADKSEAEQNKVIEGLVRQVDALKVERQQLIEAGEAARTEAAKSQMQVERADKAAEKAEVQVAKLQEQLDLIKEQKAEALKYSAVAEQQSSDLIEQVQCLRESSSKLLDQLDQLKEQKAEAFKRTAVAEQQSGNLEEQIRTLRETSGKTEEMLISQIQYTKAELAKLQKRAEKDLTDAPS